MATHKIAFYSPNKPIPCTENYNIYPKAALWTRLIVPENDRFYYMAYNNISFASREEDSVARATNDQTFGITLTGLLGDRQ